MTDEPEAPKPDLFKLFMGSNDLIAGGLVNEDAADEIDSIGLPEKSYKEETIGELSSRESAVFVELHHMREDLDNRSRQYIGRGFQKIGKAIQTNKMTDTSGILDVMADVPEDERAEFFKIMATIQLMETVFKYGISNRLNIFDWRIGIRAGRRIVKIEPKYNNPE